MPSCELQVRRPAGWGSVIAPCFLVLAACGSNRSMEPSASADGQPTTPADDGAALPFCARDRSDPVRDLFCGDAAVEIRSLDDLELSLGLRFAAADGGAYG